MKRIYFHLVPITKKNESIIRRKIILGCQLWFQKEDYDVYLFGFYPGKTTLIYFYYQLERILKKDKNDLICVSFLKKKNIISFKFLQMESQTHYIKEDVFEIIDVISIININDPIVKIEENKKHSFGAVGFEIKRNYHHNYEKCEYLTWKRIM